MDEQVYVKGVPKGWRDHTPQEALLHLVVGTCEFDTQDAEESESLQNSADVGVHGKRRTVKRTHHYAGRALRPYFGEVAEEVKGFIVTPRARGLESAAAEEPDESSEGLFEAMRLSPAKPGKTDRAFDFVCGSAGKLLPRRVSLL